MIPVCEPKLSGKELEYVTECIKTNWISSKGRYITEFEEKFSKYCNAKFGIATMNGTTAIHLALASLGIKSGDEVILPTFTMIATVNPIAYCGAKPVLIDAETETWNIDPSKIEEKITDKTKAILVVHTYGHPCNMDPILEIARKYGLYVIEDAAEAHGAEYNGKKVGVLGDVGCFSFYANKIITTGEGGMVITNDEKIAEMANLLRDQAFEKEKRFWHRYIGYNYRITNLQAAIGVAQMDIIDESVNTRRKNAQIYNLLLKNLEGITLPPEAQWAKNIYWMYTIMFEDSFGMSRDGIMNYLKKKGVDTRSTFYPIHTQPVYAKLYANEKYPVAEKLSRRGINLPSGNTLKKEDIKYVVECIKSASKENG